MIDHCDYCNKPCCYDCPYAEEESTFEQNLEVGWDYAIERLTNSNPSNDLCVLIGLYHQAYKTEEYKQTGDSDSGLCYEIRQFAIQKILEVLNK